MERDWVIRNAEWETESALLYEVRSSVFVEEQGVDVSIERDGKDDQCHHSLAHDSSGKALGTGRLSPEGKIGRLAVLKEWRGSGIGSEIMRNLIKQSESLGMVRTYLHSQVAVTEFYESLGYRQEGPIFEEASIPHVVMFRESDNA
jgi:predicted GNAT family N-acyltransferase